MATTVTVKGQVTIPKEVRDLLGLQPGSEVSFDLEEDGRVVLKKVPEQAAGAQPPSRFAAIRGTATAGLTTEEIMAMTRGEPD
jgi:AbrB family looped-hinge helix DNA binding protein